MFTFRAFFADGVFARTTEPLQSTVTVLNAHHWRSRWFRRRRRRRWLSINRTLVDDNTVVVCFTDVIIALAVLFDFLDNGDDLVVTGGTYLFVEILAVLADDFITVGTSPFHVSSRLADRTLLSRCRFEFSGSNCGSHLSNYNRTELGWAWQALRLADRTLLSRCRFESSCLYCGGHLSSYNRTELGWAWQALRPSPCL